MVWSGCFCFIPWSHHPTVKRPIFSSRLTICTVASATIKILYNDRPTWVRGEGWQAKEFGLEKDALLFLSMAC